MPLTPFQAKDHANEQPFIYAYGQAMLQWSYVEDRLFMWFFRLTSLKENMARAVFFSARSFQGRLDMVNAVIHEKTDDDSLNGDNLATISEIFKKAALYAGYRNALAHGLGIFVNEPSGALKPILVQGKHKRIEYEQLGLAEARILLIGTNFEKLQDLMIRALRAYRSGGSTPIREYLEQLEMLPNEADQGSPSRKQENRQRQRKLVPRKR